MDAKKMEAKTWSEQAKRIFRFISLGFAMTVSFSDDPGTVNAGYIPDDARSHLSQFSTRSRSRSMADGRSEHGLFGGGGGGYQSQFNTRNGKLSSF